MFFDNVTTCLVLMSCCHLTLIRLFVCFAYYLSVIGTTVTSGEWTSVTKTLSPPTPMDYLDASSTEILVCRLRLEGPIFFQIVVVGCWPFGANGRCHHCRRRSR